LKIEITETNNSANIKPFKEAYLRKQKYYQAILKAEVIQKKNNAHRTQRNMYP